jgi:hypothetical protein
MPKTKLDPAQKAAQTRKRRAAGQKAAITRTGAAPKSGIRVAGKRTIRGKNMTKGQGWRLISAKQREFVGTLLQTFNMGDVRLAIFSVPK